MSGTRIPIPIRPSPHPISVCEAYIGISVLCLLWPNPLMSTNGESLSLPQSLALCPG